MSQLPILFPPCVELKIVNGQYALFRLMPCSADAILPKDWKEFAISAEVHLSVMTPNGPATQTIAETIRFDAESIDDAFARIPQMLKDQEAKVKNELAKARLAIPPGARQPGDLRFRN